MTTLGDATGGPQMIQSLIEAMKTLSLGYAGTPGDAAQINLQNYVDNVQPHLAESLGLGTATKIIAAFKEAVIGLKHEIEARGSSRA
jgi:hypothetical protein